MSIAEMKLAAIDEISKLTDEKLVKEILKYLAEISEKKNNEFDADAFFEKASGKYDDVLQKLAQ